MMRDAPVLAVLDRSIGKKLGYFFSGVGFFGNNKSHALNSITQGREQNKGYKPW